MQKTQNNENNFVKEESWRINTIFERQPKASNLECVVLLSREKIYPFIVCQINP